MRPRRREVFGKPPSDRQEAALRGIVAHLEAETRFPTNGELRRALSITSTTQLEHILSALEAKGYIRLSASGTIAGVTDAGRRLMVAEPVARAS